MKSMFIHINYVVPPKWFDFYLVFCNYMGVGGCSIWATEGSVRKWVMLSAKVILSTLNHRLCTSLVAACLVDMFVVAACAEAIFAIEDRVCRADGALSIAWAILVEAFALSEDVGAVVAGRVVVEHW